MYFSIFIMYFFAYAHVFGCKILFFLVRIISILRIVKIIDLHEHNFCKLGTWTVHIYVYSHFFPCAKVSFIIMLVLLSCNQLNISYVVLPPISITNKDFFLLIPFLFFLRKQQTIPQLAIISLELSPLDKHVFVYT